MTGTKTLNEKYEFWATLQFSFPRSSSSRRHPRPTSFPSRALRTTACPSPGPAPTTSRATSSGRSRTWGCSSAPTCPSLGTQGGHFQAWFRLYHWICMSKSCQNHSSFNSYCVIIFPFIEHPCISLRLHNNKKPINILTGMDYWLDNLMCQVRKIPLVLTTFWNFS